MNTTTSNYCFNISKSLEAIDSFPMINNFLFKHDVFDTVGNRSEVWHWADVCVSSARRCRWTGFNCFFIRKTRFSQMYVYINKTGKNETIIKINNVTISRKAGTNRNNLPVANKNIFFAKSRIVKNHSVLQQTVHLGKPLCKLPKRYDNHTNLSQYFIISDTACQATKLLKKG